MHEDDYCFNKIISLLALLLGETGVMSDIRACMWPSLTAWPLHASVPKEQANCRNPTRSILNKEIYLDVRVKAGFFSWPNVSAMLLAVTENLTYSSLHSQGYYSNI